MGSVKIDGVKAKEARVAAKNLEQSIDKTYDTCNQLMDYTNSAQWSGKSKDAFLTYLEIIQKYHKDLKSAVAKQTAALNHLEGYMGDFLQDESVKEVEKL